MNHTSHAIIAPTQSSVPAHATIPSFVGMDETPKTNETANARMQTPITSSGTYPSTEIGKTNSRAAPPLNVDSAATRFWCGVTMLSV